MSLRDQAGRQLAARLGLAAAALIWGTSFAVLKNTLDHLSPLAVLAMRFTAASVLLGLVFRKRLKALGRSGARRGLLLGVVLFLAYTVQTFGLAETTPGKNAFLTAVYVVLVPFLAALVLRRRLHAHNWIAAVLCLAGIGLLSLNGSLAVQRGDGLTLLGGFFYAVHILMLAEWTQDHDPIALTVIQFMAAAVLCWGGAWLTGTLPASFPAAEMPAVLYLAVFATAAALVLQAVGQRIVPESTAALLLSLESAFGVLFSVLLGMEVLTLRIGFGFAVIFAGVLVSELAGAAKRV